MSGGNEGRPDGNFYSHNRENVLWNGPYPVQVRGHRAPSLHAPLCRVKLPRSSLTQTLVINLQLI